VLIAQALAEYGALAAVVEAFQWTYMQATNAVGGYGATAILVLLAVAVVWRIVVAVR
jgi:hypothetical protein